MKKIFLNYRRDDSRGEALSLKEHLARHLGARRLFMDIGNLERGKKFDIQIDQSVAACSAMVVIIGPQWLTLTDEDGTVRLNAETDFVRYEIERAIHHDKPLLPVLIDDTPMPRSADLPRSIRQLTRWNGMSLRFENFEQDAEAVAQALKRMISAKGIQPLWLGAAAAGALVVGLAAGPYLEPVSGMDWGPAGHREKLADVTARLDEATGELKAANGTVADLHRRLNEKNEELLQTQKEISALREEKTQASNERNAAVSERTFAARNRDKTLKELALAEAALVKTQTELERLLADKEQIASERLAAVTDLDAVKSQFSDITAKFDLAVAERASAVEKIATLEREIARLEAAAGQLDDLRAARDNAARAFEAAANQVDTLEDSVDELKAKIGTLCSRARSDTAPQWLEYMVSDEGRLICG